MAGATILDVVYGMDVRTDGADYFDVVQNAMHILSDIANGSFLGELVQKRMTPAVAHHVRSVDVLPICKHKFSTTAR